MNEEILIPKERKDSIVLVGITQEGSVEFIKVYGIGREIAVETLERYMNAEGLHPADFVLLEKGEENVKGKTVISVNTEEKLRLALAKLGLRMISNGVLYLEDVKKLYQVTLIRKELYNRVFRRSREKNSLFEETFGGIIEFFVSHGLSVLVENKGGLILENKVPKRVEILYEPSISEVAKKLRLGDSPIVVETKNAKKYAELEIPVVLKIPQLNRNLFKKILEKSLMRTLPEELLSVLPQEKLTLRNAQMIAKVYKLLVENGIDEKKALEMAVSLNTGYKMEV